MASIQTSLNKIMEIDGALGAAIVDYESGVTLGTIGGGSLDMELAGAGNTRVVLLILENLSTNDLDEPPEDVLLTLGGQYHLTRFSTEHDAVFTYLILDREASNLALSRRQLAQVEADLVLDQTSGEDPF